MLHDTAGRWRRLKSGGAGWLGVPAAGQQATLEAASLTAASASAFAAIQAASAAAATGRGAAAAPGPGWRQHGPGVGSRREIHGGEFQAAQLPRTAAEKATAAAATAAAEHEGDARRVLARRLARAELRGARVRSLHRSRCTTYVHQVMDVPVSVRMLTCRLLLAGGIRVAERAGGQGGGAGERAEPGGAAGPVGRVRPGGAGGGRASWVWAALWVGRGGDCGGTAAGAGDVVGAVLLSVGKASYSLP